MYSFGRPKFVRVRNGHFWIGAQRWRINGVNYAPSSSIGTEDEPYFNEYLSAQSYDTAIVDRDLHGIAAAGMNEITAWIDTSEASSWNLLDLLRLAAKHHLRVNLCLRPGMPQQWNWPAQQRLIGRYRLRSSGTIFAYGIAWEPGFGTQAARAALDPAWRHWIVAHYGDLTAAERAWRFTTPRNARGEVTNPSDRDIASSAGPWSRMVVAYRHFADDWLASTYGAVRNQMHAQDPNHAIAFRMAWAGDPTDDGATNMPYQFPGLARAVDMLEPEGYGRVGDWRQIRPGRFEIDYARAVAPHLPVFWAEVGYSVQDPLAGGPTAQTLTRQARFYRDFYRLVRESRDDGVVFWWFPGGFRVNEGSDMGIVNPDGSDRPVTSAIRQESRILRNSPFPPAPQFWLTFNADKHPDGVYGIYRACAAKYWAAIAAGKRVGLRSNFHATRSPSQSQECDAKRHS